MPAVPTLSGVGRGAMARRSAGPGAAGKEARQALGKAIAMGATFDMYVRRRVPWDRPEELRAYARRPAQGWLARVGVVTVGTPSRK
jgi:hypothetical protein